MMQKIPTAEDFIRKNWKEVSSGINIASKKMVEFTKMHVEAALEAANKNARIRTRGCSDGWECWSVEEIDENSILESYSIENIK